jgi:ABC-2 type transport system ATP-binding protein
MSLVIEIENLSKMFGGKKVVDSLTLQVPAGSIFGFLGPNGAGKTTTVKMMLGLTRPDGGRGQILGRDIIRESEAIRSRTGYVAEVQQMYGYMTVQEIIRFCRPFYSTWNDSLTNKYLDFFDLPVKEKIKNLSKGMKTQLALVLGMAPEPELLVLDEPTSGLDTINRQELLRIILEEISMQGRTVFLSSHLLHDVERVADQVAIISKGKLIEIRSVDELKTSVKKVRVVFQKDVPDELFTLPGIQSYSREGNAYLLTVEDHLQEILNSIRVYPYYTLDIIDQNLEEIFIEKVRRDKA